MRSAAFSCDGFGSFHFFSFLVLFLDTFLKEFFFIAVETRCKIFSIKEETENKEYMRTLDSTEKIWPRWNKQEDQSTHLTFGHARGNVRVHFQEDSLLERIGMQNSSKDIEVQSDTVASDFRMKIIEMMVTGLGDQIQKGFDLFCGRESVE